MKSKLIKFPFPGSPNSLADFITESLIDYLHNRMPGFWSNIKVMVYNKELFIAGRVYYPHGCAEVSKKSIILLAYKFLSESEIHREKSFLDTKRFNIHNNLEFYPFNGNSSELIKSRDIVEPKNTGEIEVSLLNSKETGNMSQIYFGCRELYKFVCETVKSNDEISNDLLLDGHMTFELLLGKIVAVEIEICEIDNENNSLARLKSLLQEKCSKAFIDINIITNESGTFRLPSIYRFAGVSGQNSELYFGKSVKTDLDFIGIGLKQEQRYMPLFMRRLALTLNSHMQKQDISIKYCFHKKEYQVKQEGEASRLLSDHCNQMFSPRLYCLSDYFPVMSPVKFSELCSLGYLGHLEKELLWDKAL